MNWLFFFELFVIDSKLESVGIFTLSLVVFGLSPPQVLCKPCFHIFNACRRPYIPTVSNWVKLTGKAYQCVSTRRFRRIGMINAPSPCRSSILAVTSLFPSISIWQAVLRHHRTKRPLSPFCLPCRWIGKLAFFLHLLAITSDSHYCRISPLSPRFRWAH